MRCEGDSRYACGGGNRMNVYKRNPPQVRPNFSFVSRFVLKSSVLCIVVLFVFPIYLVWHAVVDISASQCDGVECLAISVTTRRTTFVSHEKNMLLFSSLTQHPLVLHFGRLVEGWVHSVLRYRRMEVEDLWTEREGFCCRTKEGMGGVQCADGTREMSTTGLGAQLFEYILFIITPRSFGHITCLFTSNKFPPATMVSLLYNYVFLFCKHDQHNTHQSSHTANI